METVKIASKIERLKGKFSKKVTLIEKLEKLEKDCNCLINYFDGQNGFEMLNKEDNSIYHGVLYLKGDIVK